jgi:uncharacterized Tic20 family protein
MQLKTKAILAHMLVILNLLFPFVYAFILLLWFKNRKSENELLRVSVNEAVILASISTIIFVSIVAAVLFHFGFKSTFTLVAGEIYYMLLVPLFFVPAILGVAKTSSMKVYYYPLIGRFLRDK